MRVQDVTSDEPGLHATDPVAAGRVAVEALRDRVAVEALRDSALAALGASPAEVAGMVVDGIRSGRFYMLTSDNRHGSVPRRGEEIVAGGPPTAPVDFV